MLLARLIQDSFERGDRIVDLGSEYLDCKRPWLTRLAESYHVTHFRPSGPKAQALRLKRWLAWHPPSSGSAGVLTRRRESESRLIATRSRGRGAVTILR